MFFVNRFASPEHSNTGGLSNEKPLFVLKTEQECAGTAARRKAPGRCRHRDTLQCSKLRPFNSLRPRRLGGLGFIRGGRREPISNHRRDAVAPGRPSPREILLYKL